MQSFQLKMIFFQRINHDYSDQSINEDAKMMAFFDSLIQREIEGWDSSSDDSALINSDSEDEQVYKLLPLFFSLNAISIFRIFTK